MFALHFGLSAGARATSSPALRRGALRTLALACPMLWLRTIGTLGVFRSIEPMLWTLVSMLPEIVTFVLLYGAITLGFAECFYALLQGRMDEEDGLYDNFTKARARDRQRAREREGGRPRLAREV